MPGAAAAIGMPGGRAAPGGRGGGAAVVAGGGLGVLWPSCRARCRRLGRARGAVGAGRPECRREWARMAGAAR